MTCRTGAAGPMVTVTALGPEPERRVLHSYYGKLPSKLPRRDGLGAGAERGVKFKSSRPSIRVRLGLVTRVP